MSSQFLITGAERRRSFSDEQKIAWLNEAFAPGGSVSRVCEREGLCSSLFYRWRRQFAGARGGSVQFDPAVVVNVEPSAGRPSERDALVVDLPSGVRVRVLSAASADLVAAALKALR